MTVRLRQADLKDKGAISMWPSEELASRLYNLANVGLIVGLVIGVVATILLVWMGNTKEIYLQKRVALANSAAAHANSSAAEANERAENARERAAELSLETENLRLQAAKAELELHRLMAPVYQVPVVNGDAIPDLAHGFTQRVLLTTDTRIEAPRLPSMPQGGSIRWTLFLDQDAIGNRKFSILFSPLPNEILALSPNHRSTFEYVTYSYGRTSQTGGIPLINQPILP